MTIALLLVLAGCGGASTSSPSPMTQANSERPTDTVTATPTSTPTATAAPEPSYDNPWNVATIRVEIENQNDRNYEPAVRDAIDYWEEHAAQHTEWHDVAFEIVPQSAESDVTIRFGTIERRDAVGNETVGCAPYPGSDGFQTDPVVEISTGYTNRSTVTILKHEVGHTLGVEHTQQPAFMTPEIELATLPQRDAVDKPNPWEQDTLRVYVDDSDVPEPVKPTVATQISHVFRYYNAGGEGATPDDVELVRTDTRRDADIVVEAVRNGDIDERRYADGIYYGVNLDEDQPIERVENGTVHVAYDVEGETGYIGYATGYWIGVFLTLEDEPAPPWADDGITYRDEWWERAG
jgi:hypothetical protein